MMKTHKQRASAEKRKHWMAKGTGAAELSGRDIVIARNFEVAEPERVLVYGDTHTGKGKTVPLITYAVMVKLVDKPRAERLSKDSESNGLTTARKAKAAEFHHEDAAKAAATIVSGRDEVERAWAVKA